MKRARRVCFPGKYIILSAKMTEVFRLTGQISRANLLRPRPQFGDMSIVQPVGYSWYHSLQARGEKRFSQGYTLQVDYTFSKFMQATEFLNPTDATPSEGISDMDRPHVFTLSGLWELN
jgi:hypothetical protein